MLCRPASKVLLQIIKSIRKHHTFCISLLTSFRFSTNTRDFKCLWTDSSSLLDTFENSTAVASKVFSSYIIIQRMEFKLISARCFDGWIVFKLINYIGILCGIHRRYASTGGRCTIELCMCVLEDIEKQEWLEYVHFSGG
uniref:Uncharacterized protein n=1 Tax=Brassica oleracea TaxID=3712 RepID=A0A3P6CI74_BRAOL|nr:unnamed protein product [Brassica oleracea]